MRVREFAFAISLPLALAAWAVVTAAPIHAQTQPAEIDVADELSAFARRYAEAWSSQNPDNVAAFFREDGRLTVNGSETAAGREAIAATARGFMEAFPDMVVAFDRLERTGERVLFHWTLTGTNTGPGGAGAAVRISGLEAWLVGPEGLIADSAGSFDAEDYARQLAGLEPDADGKSGMAESEIRAAIGDWIKIYNRNDWALLADQFTSDAVMMPPNSPAVMGRAAIAAWEAANESGFRIALMPDEIFVSGNLAIVHGRSCVFIPLQNGQAAVDVGKFLEVRRRQPDGRWLVSHDAFNSDLPTGSDLASECPGSIAGASIEAERAVDSEGSDRNADLTQILDNRTRVIIEGIRSGDVSGIMALYGSGSLYAADNATLLADPASIRAFWVNVAASPAHDATLEVLRIERLSPDAFVEIQKYDVFDASGVRMFGGYASLLWRRVEGRWIIAADVSN